MIDKITMPLSEAKAEIDRIIRENRAILTLQSILDSAVSADSEVAAAKARTLAANKEATDAESDLVEVKAKIAAAIVEESKKCAAALDEIRAKHRSDSADTLNRANAILNESVSAAKAAQSDLMDITRQIDEAESTLAVIKGDIITVQELQASERKKLETIRAAIAAATKV
jgi:chromosome segregation ATPase